MRHDMVLEAALATRDYSSLGDFDAVKLGCTHSNPLKEVF